MTTYSKETALYDTGAIGDDIAEAGTSATNYLANVSSGGVYVHPSDTPSDYTDLDANGILITDNVDVIRSGRSYAEFGDDSRIGTEEGNRVEISSDEFTAYNNESIPFFKVDYDGGIDTIVTIENWYAGYNEGRDAFTKENPSTNTWYTVFNKTRTQEYPQENAEYSINSGGVRLIVRKSISSNDHLTTKKVSSNPNNITVETYNKDNNYIQILMPVDDFTSGTSSYSYTGDVTLRTWKDRDITFRVTIQFDKISGLSYSFSDKVEVKTSDSYPILKFSYSLYSKFTHEEATTTTTKKPSYNLGYRNINDTAGGYSTIIGRDLYAGNSNQLVIGSFNDNQSNTAFEIGNGTADDARSNAFMVDWNGDIYPQATKMVDFVVEQGAGWDGFYRKWNSGNAEYWYNEGSSSGLNTAVWREPIWYGDYSRSNLWSGLFNSTPRVYASSNHQWIISVLPFSITKNGCYLRYLTIGQASGQAYGAALYVRGTWK